MKEFAGYRKGINLGGWLSQCIHSREHHESFITENYINRRSHWGLDHIRLSFDYELSATENGSFIEEGFS